MIDRDDIEAIEAADNAAARKLDHASATGGHVGLNADWITRAWFFGNGVFVLDAETPCACGRATWIVAHCDDALRDLCYENGINPPCAEFAHTCDVDAAIALAKQLQNNVSCAHGGGR